MDPRPNDAAALPGSIPDDASRCRRLSVLMPVYNEARTLRTIVAKVLASPVQCEIELICVDDASNDRSWEIMQSLAEDDPRIKTIRRPINQGKGACIQSAIRQMTGDVALIQDADLEYDPSDYPALLAPILAGKADAVFGSRFASSSQRRLLLFWHALANRALTFMANLLNDLNMTDVETCYKAVRADLLRQIPLSSKRFGIEPELTTRLAQMNCRIYEVPVSYHGRTRAEGKKIRMRDGFEAAWCLLKYRFLDTRFTTHDGYYILESLRRAKGFNRWMLRQFERCLGDRILEAGCGIGNLTEQLLDRERLICADHDPFYIEMIARRFGYLENVRVLELDLARAADYDKIRGERIDSIVCCNVLEHIDADAAAMANFHAVLQPGGHAVILVPAHAWLYSECDRALGHFRRYAPADLRALMEQAGFEVVHLQQFNRLGVLGWWINKLRKRAALSPGQMKLFEWLLPLAKTLDALKAGPGLSVIAIGRKPAAADATLYSPP